jgi:CelD/BcsL family acetyltransferase involved in cellulose biosynthesis
VTSSSNAAVRRHAPARSVPQARLAQVHELSADEIAQWEELARHASEPNPFFEPDFVLSAAATLGEKVKLLIAEDNYGWCGCLPVQAAARARQWKHVPVRGMVAWTHRYCFLGTPLLRQGSEVAASQALVRRGASVGFLGIDLLTSGGAVSQALGEACGSEFPLVVFTESERGAVHRTYPAWGLQMSAKRRRELRRQRRRFDEAVGGEVRTVDRAGDPAAVERFLELEGSGWKGANGTALCSDPAHTAFFRKICRAFGERGKLQLLSLEAGGTSYAMLCSLIGSTTMFQFKIAFDESWAQFSPGIQIEADAVERMGSAFTDVRLIDSCADPANAMANRFFPDRIQLQTVAIPGGFGGRRSLMFMRAALRARNAVRRLK